MTASLEIQLEKMDSKLEKHMGITEAILKNQQETLSEIRDIVKDHADKFLSRDEAELMEAAALAKASKEVNEKLSGFEARLDRKYLMIGTIVTGAVGGLITLLQFIPTMLGG